MDEQIEALKKSSNRRFFFLLIMGMITVGAYFTVQKEGGVPGFYIFLVSLCISVAALILFLIKARELEKAGL